MCLCRKGNDEGLSLLPTPVNRLSGLSEQPRVTQIPSLLSLPIGVGMKLTDVGIATLAKG